MTATQQIKRLNWGCGPAGVPGWINSDLNRGPGIDITGDIRKGLPIETDSLDYIVSIHALEMITLLDIVPVLRELRRVLKPGGVLRLGLPDLDRGIDAYLSGRTSHFFVPDERARSLGGKFIVHMLWFGETVTLFTPDFAEELLVSAGYGEIAHCDYRETRTGFEGITGLDDREGETFFVEAVKPVPAGDIVAAGSMVKKVRVRIRTVLGRLRRRLRRSRRPALRRR